jgi:hypothetical protein
MLILMFSDIFVAQSGPPKCDSGPFQDPSEHLHMEFEETGEYFNGKVVAQPEDSEKDEGVVGNLSQSVGSYLWSS